MKQAYNEALRDAIRRTHGCDSRHVETVPVHEAFEGKTVWDGCVEVFDLVGHPMTSQGYAWGFRDDRGQWQYVAVLKVPPVDSPITAVQAYILMQQEGRKDAQ